MDGVMREMPKYLCHKEVHALKIAKIVCDGEGHEEWCDFPRMINL